MADQNHAAAETSELQQLRTALLDCLPQILGQLAEPDRDRAALVVRAQSDSGRVELEALPLEDGTGMAALQILDQLHERPRRVAALITAFCRQSDSRRIQVSITCAAFGVHEIYLQEFTDDDGEYLAEGLISIGSFEPLYDDPLHQALDCSLLL